jgi:hypothetical protein
MTAVFYLDRLSGNGLTTTDYKQDFLRFAPALGSDGGIKLN